MTYSNEIPVREICAHAIAPLRNRREKITVSLLHNQNAVWIQEIKHLFTFFSVQILQGHIISAGKNVLLSKLYPLSKCFRFFYFIFLTVDPVSTVSFCLYFAYFAFTESPFCLSCLQIKMAAVLSERSIKKIVEWHKTINR